MFRDRLPLLLAVTLALLLAGCSRDPLARFDAELTKQISADRIGAQLRELTRSPHRAGSDANRKAGDAILKRLQESGLQPVVREYEVTLHEPEEASLELLTPENVSFNLREKAFAADPDTEAAGSLIPYFAYVPDFDVSAEVVYANYGSREDYELLKKNGVSVEGKIALVRAQGPCRGMKGIVAEEEKLSGLLLYPELKDMGFVYPPYPSGRHLNPWTVEYGSMLRYFLYPGDPASEGAARAGSTLPRIPALPVSEETAAALLSRMHGAPVPKQWQGAMKTSYLLASEAPKVRMSFRGRTEQRAVRNILLTIPGTHASEPRILVGAHYDAWVYGAADPSSATAVNLELAGALAQMMKDGWKPRRSIQFAFWDAEEFGMLGSTRWIEDNLDELRNHVAVYLSVDTAVRAHDFVGYVQPGLRAPLDRALARVQDPGSGKPLSELRGEFVLPGFSGDVAPFTSVAGIPTAELAFGRFYPVYHSIYDDYGWYSRFADPGFRYTAALTRILGLYLHSWSNDTLLPFQFREIAESTRTALADILRAHPQWKESPANRELSAQIDRFESAAAALDRPRGTIPDVQSEQVNTELHLAFRAFIHTSLDFPVRNALLGPSAAEGCSSDVLPSLRRADTDTQMDAAALGLQSMFKESTAHLEKAASLLTR